jgi:hypothetical protein
MRFAWIISLFALAAISALPLFPQSPNANINGSILDPSGAAVGGAEIVAANDATGVQYGAKANSEGIYVVPGLPPGPYRVQVSKAGFKTVIKPDVVLSVQSALSLNFTLPVGATFEVVTVQGGGSTMNTESAAVSTVVDRQFAENLPMNGRSFQTLIQLTPGIVVTPSTATNDGQFSVNGQRSSTNYWMVDGVSANIGISSGAIPGNGLAGSIGSFSTLGGTNSLVSIDAMQEFRIQTSTFAPEFGRTPGAQISIVTRSGTNSFHGTVFDYVRNDLFDANDWFADQAGLSKPRERQNDFGGTFSGPIRADHAFFFFSYEGLRLRLPQVSETTVPDISSRESAIPSMRIFLNAFPIPSKSAENASGTGTFDASYSNPATLDAYSLRLDDKPWKSLSIFGRYNYSPSSLQQHGAFGDSPNVVETSEITTKTATAGSTWNLNTNVVGDFRFNYSKTASSGMLSLDNLGGAVPLTNLPLPPRFTAQDSGFSFSIMSLTNNNGLQTGTLQSNLQNQINLVDNISVQRGSHNIRLGVDYRRLSPQFQPHVYDQQVTFSDVASTEIGTPLVAFVEADRSATVLLHNLGAFVQDTWRAFSGLTFTYGVRWDVDFAPSIANGPAIPSVTGYNLTNLSGIGLAPPGTPPFQTTFSNFAPRFGVAYQLRQSPRWGTILRAGSGVFYDLATQQVGNAILGGTYPFGAINLFFGGRFPLSPASSTPPAIVLQGLTRPGEELFAFDPHLQLPYTIQWNAALEQMLGDSQALSISYIGSMGQRLMQTAEIGNPNPNFSEIALVTNASTSDYDALQLQFRRTLSRGLQVLASYTWSHSIDTGSDGSWGDGSGHFSPALGAEANRGPSDFDIRHSFSGAVTYSIPVLTAARLRKKIFEDWSVETVVQARSAPPVDISDSNFFQFANGAFGDIRPDLVPGQPVYLFGHDYPGGKAFNPAAFANPPGDLTTGVPLREGDVPRNFLRAFGAVQLDYALHRDIHLSDSVKLQARAEAFNVLNHPNFGPPNGAFGLGGFGLASQMLGQSLSGGSVGSGGLSPLYQLGGPRSLQFALKLMF